MIKQKTTATKNLLNAAEAAELLGITRGRLMQIVYADNSKFRGEQVGSIWLFNRRTIERIKNQRQKKKSEKLSKSY